MTPGVAVAPIVLVLALAAAAAPAGAAPATYRIRDLGTIAGMNEPSAINDSDEVVGSGYGQAWRWTAASGMQYLDSIADFGSGVAAALDNRGRVAGQLWRTGRTTDAIVWGPGGQVLRDVATPAPTGVAAASGINDRGQVCGFEDGDGPERAVLWEPDGSRTVLGTLSPANPSARAEAHGLNASGEVVGISSARRAFHAFAWTAASGMVDLGALPGQDSSAAAVNAHGIVVGNSRLRGAPDPSTAIAWIPNRGMVPLAALPGQSVYGATASAVNAAGDIVGTYAFDNGGIGNGRPCIWVAADGYAAYDLPDLVDPADPLKDAVTFYQASGINTAGHIVVRGYDHASQAEHVFILEPEGQ